ncbi:ATP-binding protein [Adlercreutzia sp. ZJ141]|uniref:ATP-binding protein n=1 Tax=Adlercreutzia sp. ZJ141 TaxID=2709406 RepID=UPI0013ED9CD1|nr:ATP-binding protein [Adlercreutzia sp. ZJ141]
MIFLYHLFIISLSTHVFQGVEMPNQHSMDLVYSLVGYPAETEWLEFKENNKDPQRTGRDISALANAAAFCGHDYGYKIWGVRDSDHALVGTTFDYLRAKGEGNQDLLVWLTRHLTPNANYEFSQVTDDTNRRFVILKVRAASGQPVRFNNAAYIREGNATTCLALGSAKEEELWRRLQRATFEFQTAIENIPAKDVRELLAVDAYFDLLGLKQPTDLASALIPFAEQELIKYQDDGNYAITNLGALLLAKKLSGFPGLRKRPLRVIRFEGKSNLNIIADRTFDEGYALVIPQAESYIMASLPAKEISEGAFRKIQYAYPQAAIRELLINAIVHQDATVTTAGPLVKIYDNRIEFSNPGSCLIPTDRILNAQPKTRNNGLVRMLRQMDLCEEGGTGWDRAVEACESRFMPAPKIISTEDLGTTVSLYSDSAFDRMTKTERMEALYWHACLMYAQDESMGNQSLRSRFGLNNERKNTLAISRLIREACEKELIKEEDENAGTKFKRYIPHWA